MNRATATAILLALANPAWWILMDGVEEEKPGLSGTGWVGSASHICTKLRSSRLRALIPGPEGKRGSFRL